MKEKISTVDDAEIKKFSAMAEQWWDERGKFAPLHRMNPCRIGYIKDKIQAAGLAIQGLRLLDIGCGGGLISEPFARLGARVTGVDASEKNISIAKAHAQQSGLAIDYRCTTAEDLLSSLRAQRSNPATHREESWIATSPAAPRNDGLYDVVLALEIIEHVADVEAFIAASCALVKPGGLIFFSTLNRTAKSYALAILGAEYIMRWLPVGTHDWKKFLRPHEIITPLRRNGIDEIEMTGMVYNPLNAQWRLDAKDVGVNYVVVGRKKLTAIL